MPAPGKNNGQERSEPALALDGLPHCDVCADIRWVRATVPMGHRQWGQLIRCPKCGALAERLRRRQVYASKQARLERYTQKLGRYHRQTFASFDPRAAEREAGDVREALATARAFADNPKGWLVISGVKGAGKTHLASAICHHVEESDQPDETRPLVLYQTTPDLLELLRSGYEHEDHGELLNICRSVDVLILDDLGVESQRSEWVLEKLYSILNYRYQAELPTVVVTNLPIEAMPARIYSRLADDQLCRHIEIAAPDYRQRKRHPGRVVA